EIENLDKKTDNLDDTKKKKKSKDVKTKTVQYKYRYYNKFQGIVPKLVEKLISWRKQVKEQMEKETEDSEAWVILNKRQLALKVSANGTYGFLNVKEGGKLPLPEGAMCVTAMGRIYIRKVNSFIEDGFQMKVNGILRDFR